MVQAMAHQHYIRARLHQRLKPSDQFLVQMRFPLVLEKFLAQQIQPVTADPAQHSMHHSRSKNSVHQIKNRTQHCHRQHHSTPQHAPQKTLGIGSEKGERPDGGQLQQRAFHAPVHERTVAVFWVGLFQSCSSPWSYWDPELPQNGARQTIL